MLSGTVWLLGCSVKGQELDSVIQMALFQSSVFYDCVILSAQKSATNGIFKAYYSHNFQAILCPGHPGTCQNLKPSYGCFPVHGKQSTKMSPNTVSNLFTEAKIILDLSLTHCSLISSSIRFKRSRTQPFPEGPFWLCYLSGNKKMS